MDSGFWAGYSTTQAPSHVTTNSSSFWSPQPHPGDMWRISSSSRSSPVTTAWWHWKAYCFCFTGSEYCGTEILSGREKCIGVHLGMWALAHVLIWTILYSQNRPPGSHYPHVLCWNGPQASQASPMGWQVESVQLPAAVHSWKRQCGCRFPVMFSCGAN